MAEVTDFHPTGEVQIIDQCMIAIIAPVGKAAVEKNGRLADGHHLVDPVTVLQQADLLADINRHFVNSVAADQALTGCRAATTSQQFKQRRLAEIVLGGKHVDPALGYGEVEVTAQGLALENQAQIGDPDAGRGGWPRCGCWQGGWAADAGRDMGSKVLAMGFHRRQMCVHGLLS